MTKKIKILIIEDNLLDLEVIKYKIKTSLGHSIEIVSADSIEGAIQIILDNFLEPFNLVILDLMLSDSVGLDSIDRIKDIDSTIPIIVYSGYKVNKCIQKLNVHGFISKDNANWWSILLQYIRDI